MAVDSIELQRVSALLVKWDRKQIVHEGGGDHSNLIYLGYSGVMFGHSVGLATEMKKVFGEDFPVNCRRGFGTGDQCHLEPVSTLWEHKGVELGERYMHFGGWD